MKLINYLYFIFYKYYNYPAVGALAFNLTMYLWCLYLTICYLFNISFLDDRTIYLLIGCGLVGFILPIIAYWDTERMQEKIKEFEGESRIKINIKVLLIATLPIPVILGIVFLIIKGK
jgi:hypothetical protein